MMTTINNQVVFKTKKTTSLVLKEYQWICRVFAGHRCEISGTFALWLQNALPDNRPIYDVDIKIFYWTELERQELLELISRLQIINGGVDSYNDSYYIKLNHIVFNLCLTKYTSDTRHLVYGRDRIYVSPWQSILSWKLSHNRDKDRLDIQSIMNRASIFGIDSFKLKEDLL